MEKTLKARLKYRRQYVIAPESASCNFLHNAYIISGSTMLFAHVDLNVTQVSTSDTKLILLGELFDYEEIRKDNKELLKNLLNPDFELVLKKLDRYAGRFVLIHVNDDKVSLVTDAAASRKVYYCRKSEVTYCASQPHLLASVLNFEYSKDPVKQQFYHSQEHIILNNSNIGNTTIYDEVFQLIPNHYLSFDNCNTIRFWPNQKIEIRPFQEVVIDCSKIIKGYMESIAHRFKPMLPVTGGKDSRLLLAACVDIKNELYCYINKEATMSPRHNDITIPKSLLPKLGLDFHVVDPYIETDPDFKEVYFQNNPFASEKYLPIIYNYFVNFSDKVNLPGIFVNLVEEDLYELHGKTVSPIVLAKLFHVNRFAYAEQYFAGWLNECQELCERHDLNLLNLLYWEERIANWGTQLQLDKDIAQEEIIPYNSRLLVQTMLSAELKYREKPDFLLFRGITHNLWPETTLAPCNPGFKSSALRFFKKFGGVNLVKKVYYNYIST